MVHNHTFTSADVNPAEHGRKDPRHSILVGPIVSDKYPRFIGRLARDQRVHVVDAGETTSLFDQHPWAQRTVDVMLIDRDNLALTSTWLTALAHLGADLPPVLVVQHDAPLALRVMAAHAGAVGVLDPLHDWDAISAALDHAIRNHENSDLNHQIWTEVERPGNPFTITIDIRNDLDRDIVDLVSLGLPDREVAAAVHLAEQTVRNRLCRILEHSGLKNRTELAMTRRRQLEASSMASTLMWVGGSSPRELTTPAEPDKID